MATAKRPGRPAKYDWSDKRDLCHKLYVDENKSIKEIIDHFTTALGIDASQVPSGRDFSRQFNRWKFPSHRDKLSTDDEARLVERIKQLWQANFVQKQMQDALADEGWQLDQNALARLRRKHGIMLRVAAGYNRNNMGPGTGKKRRRAAGAQTDDAPQAQSTLQDTAVDMTIDVTPAEAARRAKRLTEIQAKSDAQFDARKRRRRIRGYAHLPPDAPGLPPRYKSETCLDECKVFLSLSNELYKQIRQNFEDICSDMGIIKKRLCNDGRWDDAKNRLIRENTHLSAILNPVHGDIAERENALEVVCADVTKRMRIVKKRIFVKQANNILGLNPEESKELRRQFYEILKADHFQTMLLCGKDHWAELKQQWHNSSEVLQRLYAQDLDDEKKKCIDVLVRDATKRHNDNNVTKHTHLSPHRSSHGPGPGPARRTKDDRGAAVWPTVVSQVHSYTDLSRHMDLDPALFTALSSDLTSQLNQPLVGNRAGLYDGGPQSMPSQLGFAQVSTSSQASPVPSYFRLSTASRIIEQHPKMWLATLDSPTISALHRAAITKTKSGRLLEVSGIVKVADGREDHYQIDCEDELEAYLDTIREIAGGKATFTVTLETV